MREVNGRPISPKESPTGRYISLVTYAGAIPFALIALAVFAATAFTFLQTDDFCTFGRVIGRVGGNPFAELQTVYMHWTGRYSSSFLVALVGSASMLLRPTVIYPLALILFAAVFLFGCFKAGRTLFRDSAANVAFALAAFGGTMVIMPSKLEQYLWLTGAAVYFVGASLLILLAQRLIVMREPSRRQEVMTCLLIVLVTGFNEFLAILLGAMLAWATLDQWLLRRQNGPRLHLPRLLVFGAAFAVSVLAPGNFARDATATVARHEFGGATTLMTKSLGLFWTALVDGSLGTFLAMLVGAVFAGALAWRSPLRRAREWLPYALLLLLSFPMHYWVYSFLTGEVTPGRIANQAVTLAAVALCMLMAWLGHALARRIAWRHTAMLSAILFAVAGVGLWFTPDYQRFSTTLVNFAPTWRQQQVTRHNGLVVSRGVTQPVYVRPFDVENSSPPTFKGADISGDPNNWVNRCVADYYGIRKILLMRRMPSNPPAR